MSNLELALHLFFGLGGILVALLGMAMICKTLADQDEWDESGVTTILLLFASAVLFVGILVAVSAIRPIVQA